MKIHKHTQNREQKILEYVVSEDSKLKRYIDENFEQKGSSALPNLETNELSIEHNSVRDNL